MTAFVMQGAIITHTTHLTAALIGAALLAASCGGVAAIPTVSDPPTQPLSAPSTTDVTQTTRTPTPTTSRPPTTTTEARTTTTTSAAQRRGDIETLLKPVWFGWFLAVADGDVEAVGRTTALGGPYDDAVRAINNASLEFTQPPTLDTFGFTVNELLIDRDDCIVVELTEDPTTFLAIGTVATRIGVFWEHGGYWYRGTIWAQHSPQQVLADDCNLRVRGYA